MILYHSRVLGQADWRVVSDVICRACHYRARLKVQPVDEAFTRDCEILEVPRNCDENQVRSAFIKLAKRFHPDGRTREANAEKFNEIDAAYKNMLKRFADKRHNLHKIEGEYGLYYDVKKGNKEKEDKESEENQQEDIKHTAPQHRQYLSFDGVGYGTPSSREKQYQKLRAAKAASNVHDHRIKQAMAIGGSEETAVSKDQRAAKKVLTRFGMDRLVEDMIQESMARGEFDNLSGHGKPLAHDTSYNPYVDFTTHKINQMLIENGFTPQWILLEKEIREEIEQIRQTLLKQRHRYGEILSETEAEEWKRFVERLQPTCKDLNAKIQKYNLVVPSIHKQILCLQLTRESDNAMKKFSSELRNSYLKSSMNKSKTSHKQTMSEGMDFVSFVTALFKVR